MITNTILPDTSLYYTSQHTGYVNSPLRPATAQDAIEDTLDLSSNARNVLAAVSGLAPAERNQYLENLARLLKAGIVGVETLEIDGRPYQSFASTRAADPRVAHARPYRQAP